MAPIKQCSVDGCGSTAIARGWCSKHYNRWNRTGSPDLVARRTTCSQDGCTRWTVGQGLCGKHYSALVSYPKRKAALLASKAGRICGWCGEPIDPSRPAKTIYCSRTCKQNEVKASGRQREAALRSYYKRQYGLTVEEVERMRARGCDICGASNGSGRWGQLHIDHCHDTGKVRGVLCGHCNSGVGYFRNDPSLLRAAIKYLT